MQNEVNTSFLPHSEHCKKQKIEQKTKPQKLQEHFSFFALPKIERFLVHYRYDKIKLLKNATYPAKSPQTFK